MRMSIDIDRSAPRTVRDAASFRDPAGFVYRRDGVIYRQIDVSFADRWEAVVASGLLERLQLAGLLIGHAGAPIHLAFDPATVHAVIQPDEVEFISYPYE